jgi:DNA-binding CsgD family transcriptional regulator
VVRQSESLAVVGTVVDGNLLDWQAGRVDALAALGRLEEAEDLLIRFEHLAVSAGRLASQTSAARARARLCAARGDLAAAETEYHRGLELAREGSGGPALALAELEYGAHLRRAGRRRQASDQLASALGRLRDIGASHYATRAARELASCGLQPSKRDGAGRLRLTPTELATARLAAAGNTNRQIAAELVVSEKTVEFHLVSVFRKLGVSSRRQLGGVLSDGLEGVDLSEVSGHPSPVTTPNWSQQIGPRRGSPGAKPWLTPQGEGRPLPVRVADD